MIEVHLHGVLCYIQYLSIEVVPVFILQWHYCVLVDILVVKMSVYAEYLLVQVKNSLDRKSVV